MQFTGLIIGKMGKPDRGGPLDGGAINRPGNFKVRFRALWGAAGVKGRSYLKQHGVSDAKTVISMDTGPSLRSITPGSYGGRFGVGPTTDSTDYV